MSKRKHKKPPGREPPAKPSGRRTALIAVTVLLAAVIFAAVILLRGGEPRGAGSPQVAASTLAVKAGFGALNGRWLRPDGG